MWRGRITRSAPSARCSVTVQRLAVASWLPLTNSVPGQQLICMASAYISSQLASMSLGGVFRPVRREWHVRQMVDVDLIVQRQRMVTHAPVVSDPQQLIDDQRIDVQLDQPSSDGQPVLTCADDENRGI